MNLLLKYPCLVLLLFISPLTSLSQTATSAPVDVTNSHEKLSFVFGENWVANNPELVNLYEDCYNNRLSFREEQLTTSDKYVPLSSVSLMTKNNPNVTGADFQNFNPGTFNPFTYNIEFLSDKIQVFRVDGTNWVMVISPVVR